jgi:hypothetical protein
MDYCQPQARGTKRLRKELELWLYLAALTVLLVVVCCGFLWPVWSEDARKRQAALAAALLGDDGP